MENVTFVGINHLNYQDPAFEPLLDVVGIAAFYTPERGEINWALETTLRNVIGNHEHGRYKPFIGVARMPSLTDEMIVNGELVPRPEMPTRLDGNVLRDVPLGAHLTINGESFPVEDTEIELEGPPGETLEIHLYLWPYKEKRFVYATPSV